MIKIKSRKKGAAHVEMIISFVIFISFIAFMMIVFKPLRIFQASTSSLDITEAGILEYASTNLTASSLTLNSSFSASPGACLYADFSLPNKIIIKDESAKIINATKSGEKIYFRYDSRFYKIYSSEELEERNLSAGGCQELAESNYALGVTRFYKKTSYSKLLNLNESYYNNYQQLKKDLGLRNDFNIIVRDNSGLIFEGEKYKPAGIDIKAKDISIEILDKDANLNPAIMNIQVWE